MRYNELILEIEETTIDKLFYNYEKVVGRVFNVKLFYITATKLLPEELMDANTSLLVHGKTKTNFEEFLLSFAKNHTFIGRIFKPKRYRKPLIKDGVELGFPIYYHWCKDHRVMSPPRTIGIYHLFLDGILVYIGFSRNIRNRLKNHYCDKNMPFDAVLWFTGLDLSLQEWLKFERDAIKYWSPSLNKNYVE